MFASTSCSQGFCRGSERPSCRECGVSGGPTSVFLASPLERVWTVGNLTPLPNILGDQHLYVCGRCEETGRARPSSWIHNDPRFKPGAPFPHALDDAEYMEYRRAFMANYDDTRRLQHPFAPEQYVSPRTRRGYILQFVNASNVARLAPSLTANFHTHDPSRHELEFVVAVAQEAPDIVVAYNSFRGALQDTFIRGEYDNCARVDMYSVLGAKPQFRRYTHDGVPWRERSWLEHPGVGSASIAVLPAHRGAGLATALKLYQERAFAHNAIYCSLITQVDNYSMQRAAEKAGYHCVHPYSDEYPTYKQEGNYMKAMQPMPPPAYLPEL